MISRLRDLSVRDLGVGPRPRIDSILLLPREMLLLIADFLDKRSHSALSRTCRYLTCHLQRHLFTRWSKPGHHPAMTYACGSWQPNKLPIIDRALYYRVPSDPNAVIYFGQTGLALAARKECPDALCYLLAKKANVDEMGQTGFTPLAFALEALNKINACHDSRYGSIARCVANITNLLEAGADPNCKLPPSLKDHHYDPTPVTVVLDALLEALVEGHITKEYDAAQLIAELIFHLVSTGANPNGCGRKGWSPLEWAVARNLRPLAEFLVDHGADPNYGAERGIDFLPLGHAILTGNVPAVQYLISKGANPNQASPYSLSPLFYAVQQRRNDCVIVLLQNGATPNGVETAFNSRGPYAFYVTAVSEAILQHRFSANLHFFSSMLDIFRTLLSANADPNLASILGCTPLTLALKLRYLPDRLYIVETLLNHGADPNMPDEYDYSPLALCIKAAWRHRGQRPDSLDIQLLKLLIRRGAEVNDCGDALATTVPLIIVLLDKRGGYCGSRDHERLRAVFERGQTHLREGFENPLIPILLEAGTEVNDAVLFGPPSW